MRTTGMSLRSQTIYDKTMPLLYLKSVLMLLVFIAIISVCVVVAKLHTFGWKNFAAGYNGRYSKIGYSSKTRLQHNYIQLTELFIRLVVPFHIFMLRPLFVGIMFFIRNLQTWNAGGRFITIIHYSQLYSYSQCLLK